MATTTNYGWTTPDDTDLVKDGAAAIRTLGSSADTTVKDLNPGTTAGDIDYYTSSTAKARIAIGTAGQVLQVNGGATAPEWAAPSSGALVKINSTALSAAASVTFDNVFTSTYENYFITWTQSNSTGNYAGAFQLRASGVNTNANYKSVRMTGTTAFSLTQNAFGTTDWSPWSYTAGTVGEVSYDTYLFKPQLAQPTVIVSTGWEAYGVYNWSGSQSDSTQFDGFSWNPGGASITGVITIYGIEK